MTNPTDAVVSIVMPVHNEGGTLREVLAHMDAVDMPVPWELIVVDDGSTDGAVESLEPGVMKAPVRVTVLRSRRNRGKGHALRYGFAHASGVIIGVQDADLEYNPRQIPALLMPLLEGDADVVFGTREFGAHASYSFWYVVGNRLISFTASALFNRYITDAYTCYKFFSREIYAHLNLTADGFEIEAELTGGLLRAGARVFEIPIGYIPRTREEGKHIKPSDGVRGLLRLFRVRALGY